jgi:murein DD-endopeptidase MepM/ murein hydrolase activator NlpD
VRAPLTDNNVAQGWVAEADANGELLLDGTPPPPPKLGEATVATVKPGSNYTVVGVSVNLRAAPAHIDQPADAVLAELPQGTMLTVLDGPQVADGLAWLQVNAKLPNGQQLRGWTALVDPSGIQLLMPTTTSKAIHVERPFAERWVLTQGWGSAPEFYARFVYDGVPLRGHNGLDFGTPENTPLLACDAGTVLRVDFEMGGFGHFILIQHKWGESLYAHLNRVDVTVGSTVARGGQIGRSGNTGAGTGAHLHFGIRINPYRRTDGWGGFTDPTPFMDPADLIRSRSHQHPEAMAPELMGRARP